MLKLSLVKQHCRVEHELDDQLFEVYIGAARNYVENNTRRTLYRDISEPGYLTDPQPLLLNNDVITAMLLMVGHWYENREAVVIGTITASVPLAVDALLQPYRVYGV